MAVSQSLKLSQVEQDIANRKSYIRILWESTQSGASVNNNQRTAYYWVTVNGVETKYSVNYTLPQNTKKVILDRTVECSHDASGKCTVRVRTEMDTRISAGVVKKSASITPTDIFVGGIVSAGEQEIGSDLRIVVSGMSEEQMCELRYTFGSLAGTIADGLSNESYNWTLPNSFYYEMPTATRKTGTITCVTYENETEIGRTTASFVAKITADDKPQIVGAAVKDINPETLDLTGDESVLIKGFSNAEVVSVVSPAPGSNVEKIEVICGDGQKAINNIINKVKSGQFQITVTDSRGIIVKQAFSQMLIDYMPVTCNLIAKGVDEVTGALPIVVSGICFSGTFGQKQNSYNITYRVKEENGEWQDGLIIGINYAENNRYKSEYEIGGYDYNKTYIVQAKVSDFLTEDWSEEVKVKTIPVFDWGENDFNFNVPVKMPELQLTESGIAALKKLLGIN